MSRAERDPERGGAAAAKLRALGVKGILIKAAEQGYITQVACKMPECFCPEELGGACYFEPVTAKSSDWMPTHEHFPLSKKDGGHRLVDNAILAHRLCNRIDYSIRIGRSYARDLGRVRKAREEAIHGNNELALSPAAVAAIRAAENALADAFEAPDPAAWVDFYTDDAIFVGPGTAAIEGRDAFLRAAEVVSISSMEIVAESTLGAGDFAATLGRANWVNGPKDSNSPHVRRRFVMVWRREPDNRWRIARELLNDDV